VSNKYYLFIFFQEINDFEGKIFFFFFLIFKRNVCMFEFFFFLLLIYCLKKKKKKKIYKINKRKINEKSFDFIITSINSCL
jgi:hypothetical protein